MRNLTILWMSCGLAFANAAQANDAPACALSVPARAVTSITQLPADIQKQLADGGPMADIGGPFNASDVIDPAHPVPGQRLLDGQAGADEICLHVELGGRGYRHATLVFQRAGDHWTRLSFLQHFPEKW